MQVMTSNVNNNSVNNSFDLNFIRLSDLSKFFYCVDSFNKIKGLSIIHVNLRSIVRKIDEMRVFCTIYKPDLLCITETWLNVHENFEVKINGYDIHRCDRLEGRGGGVMIYSKISGNLMLERVDENKSIGLDFVTLKLNHKYTKQFLVTCLYCPPHETQVLKEKFFDFFQDINNNENIFIGDFNIDLKNSDAKSWLSLMKNNGFIQLINEDTRITETTATIIDHIYKKKVLDL